MVDPPAVARGMPGARSPARKTWSVFPALDRPNKGAAPTRGVAILEQARPKFVSRPTPRGADQWAGRSSVMAVPKAFPRPRTRSIPRRSPDHRFGGKAMKKSGPKTGGARQARLGGKTLAMILRESRPTRNPALSFRGRG